MKKYLSLMIILFLFFSVFFVSTQIQNVSASIVVGAYNAYDEVDPYSNSSINAVHPSTNDNQFSAYSQTFLISSSTGYLDGITVMLQKRGSPEGYLGMRVYSSSAGASDSPNGETILAESFNAIPMSALTDNPSQLTFSFNWSCQLTYNTWYQWMIYVINATVIDGATNYAQIQANSGYAGSNAVWQESGDAWTIYTGDYGFTLWLSTTNVTPSPAPTATPTASPTPFTYQGDIWAALTPYGTMILPLVLILLVALLCGRYAGVWGFFAGLNIAAILVYAIMGAAYLPLWGLVMLALVDGLLLFGKISGRM